ncbi:SEC10/PgrA surface exclusion domain-containing protein [Limosilactobacillus reuteri]|uniref:SEC10/PgrA surface exclusion domain-containing protein n=1 Tax=Limosilactobacillus reuteri TaxID=1598 RepID=A0AAW4X4I9_LIMRT|nr:SEC10/PgrA surface exclusion domain-containing protein [Limosilactobacillus reuteri]MCC4477318.1 SEC10/PgrA surface exclusion domain-containing protein [Limosilactobacillus reuteri]MCC4479499.1 SEC10/PgrA surface exclusion domain-containing protein [Limosilactobacillus reuteri]MCC4498730.1 SEC10/PgrA surface exclusion domain-containing protein [Limosilactobacillus reuteri]
MTTNIKKNTKLALTAAAVAATTVATGAIATTAHADQVNANVNTNTNTQTTQSQSDLKTAQDQSRQNYADAKSANDAAQADLNNANSDNVNAENAQTAASAQEAQDAIAQQNAQDSVNAASDALAQAQSDAAKTASDPAAVDKAQSDANAASQANSQAQADLNQASENVKTAQDQAGKAQASVNQAQDQVNQANNNVKTASDAVSQAQTDLNNAKSHQQALSDAQQAVTSAQSQKDAADTNVNNAQNDFNSKQSAANNAKTNLDNAKTALDNVQKNAPVENHITVNNTYINELKKHRGQQLISNDPALDKASDDLLYASQYQSDPAAKAVAVHFDSNGVLSEADTIYATQYAAQLINEIRSQIGSPLIKINTGSIEISRDVANAYVKDHKNAYLGHDYNALTSTGNNWNTFIIESNVTGDQFGNLDPNTSDTTEKYEYQGLTRDDLQRGIYYGIREFLFDDSSELYGHTTDILGLRYTSDYDTPSNQNYMNYGNNGGIYLGVSFEYDTSDQPTEFAGQSIIHPGTFHFISEWDPDSAYAYVVESMAEHPETGNEKYRQSQWRQEITVPTATDQTSAIKSAQTAVNNAQSAYDAAKTALAQAQTALNQAKSSQASAQSKLAKAQTNLQRVQAETPSVDDAQAKLTAAQNKLASAKQMAQNAQKALENAQATKANADRALDQAENTLAGAKTKAANAQVALKQANDKLNAVLGANKKIEDAQAKLDAAKAALQVAKSNHDTSAKKLSEAKDAVKTAQDNLAKAQAHADATAKALANAKEALITDDKVYHDSVSIKPVTIHKGENVPAPEIANPMAQDPTQNLVMGAYLKLATSKLDTIPTGTTAAWSDKTQLASDAQIVGNHQEGATVTFPDGSTMTLNVPLVVLDTETPVTPTNPGKPDHGKTDDHGTAPTPSKPDQGKTDDHGTTPVTPSKPDQGKTDDHGTTPTTPSKPDQGKTDDHGTTPTTPSKPSDGYQTDTNKPSDNSHVTTPKDDTKTDTTTNTTLPSDAHVVNGQVVNAQGQVIPGFKVENGTIVATNNSATTDSVNTTAPVANATTMTREQYRASQNNKTNTDAKTLPQTGNNNELGLVGLGLLTLAGMFGLVAKRRSN